MQSDDHETRRRDRLARASQDAAAANAHAAELLAALDEGLRELTPTPVAADPRAFDVVTQELDATQRELEDARRELAALTETLRATAAPFRALLSAPVYVPPPAEALRAHEEAQAAHARATDRMAMLEAALAELTQLRSAILTGHEHQRAAS